jgi:hypothetical protein
MIHRMIEQLVQVKQVVKVYFQLGNGRSYHMTGTIAEFNVKTGYILLIPEEEPRSETIIPLASIHSIITVDSEKENKDANIYT